MFLDSTKTVASVVSFDAIMSGIPLNCMIEHSYRLI